MPEAAPGPGIARFGIFDFDPATGELRRQGARVRLQEQPARILELLLRSAGRIVTREELRDALWAADTFVDFDHSLNTAVRKLRTALDDSAETPRCIETLAKRGYRLIVPVEWIAADAAVPPPAVAAPPPETGAVPPPASASRTRRIALVAAAVIAIAALAAWAMLRPPAAETAHRRLAVLPIENADPATAYVSDGITEAIIDGLSASSSIRVTARTSSFH